MIGTIYTSPWGTYVLSRLEPVTLLALDRIGACIVNPDLANFTPTTKIHRPLMGSGTLPVALDPRNEMGNRTVTVRSTADGGDSLSESRTEIVARIPADHAGDALSVDASERRRLATSGKSARQPRRVLHADEHAGIAGSTPVIHTVDCEQLVMNRAEVRDVRPQMEVVCALPLGASDRSADEQLAIDAVHELTLGAYRSAMSLAWTPNKADDDVMVWTPCAGRSSIAEHANKTHAYFIAPFVRGSIYCPECRATRPRTLYYRDGELVHDSHHDVASAHDVRVLQHGAEAPVPEFSETGIFRPELDALARGGADVESSTSVLSAMTVAREEGPPPAPSDAKGVALPQSDAPSTCLSSEQSCLASGDQRTKNDQVPVAPAGHSFPIGRAWHTLDEWKEWCAERAAIIEYDGNMTRKIAESMARSLAGPAPRARAA